MQVLPLLPIRRFSVHFRRQVKSYFKRKAASSSWRDTRSTHLVSNEIMLGSIARALCNGLALVKLFEKNDYCLKEKNKCGSNTESDPRIKALDRNSTGHVSSIPYLRPTIPAVPSMPNVHGHQSQEPDDDFCFSRKERQRISSLGAKSDVFWQDISSIKLPFGRYNPFGKSSRPFDRSRSRLFLKTKSPFWWIKKC